MFNEMPSDSDKYYYFDLSKSLDKSNSQYNQQETWDFRESYSLGVTIPTGHVYGLAERVDTFALRDTDGQYEPYRMQALDMFPHNTFARESTYSSIPYVQGHDVKFDSNFILMTAAEAFVDIHTITTPSTS